MALPRTADVVVVGGGIVGLTIARELRRRRPTARIILLEKEPHLGSHASGRNSGVLHAGFYYTADSLKAKLTGDGNRRLAAWCDEHGVAVRRCGKLVVAKSELEHAGLDTLLERARQSKVPLESIDEEEARRIEPRARTVGRALWSPSTAAVDPIEVMAVMTSLAEREGIEVHRGTAWRAVTRDRRVLTNRGTIDAGYLVNAAGLYADRIAQSYGFGASLRILPFRGTYLYARESAPRLATHIYPVPDLAMPFLGVHFTVTVHGDVKIGPTALPLPFREAYGWSSVGRLSSRELFESASAGVALLLTDPSFRRHAHSEASKLRRRRLVAHAGLLARGFPEESFSHYGRPGIRAQLYDTRRKQLVMDFLFEGDDRSMHVLNAVSPAFTCSLPFAELVADAIAANA
ncbi:MAG TPA: L-2-hydroxyglutarate oxidase [Polyangiaceae bacterium]|nr:L-2-hydroxyglutarate oxidase [Polyangiaceae bacterium]